MRGLLTVILATAMTACMPSGEPSPPSDAGADVEVEALKCGGCDHAPESTCQQVNGAWVCAEQCGRYNRRCAQKINCVYIYPRSGDVYQTCQGASDG